MGGYRDVMLGAFGMGGYRNAKWSVFGVEAAVDIVRFGRWRGGAGMEKFYF